MTKATKKRVFRARDIGKTIKRLRRLAQKSQKEVARRAGISLQTISNIEVGRVMPDLESLCGIAYGIGIEPHVLVQHGMADGTAEQISDRAEAMEILSGLNPSATRAALDQLRAVQSLQSMNSPKVKLKV
jgi:transcriptional regulator with XRE-family HTH domain